MKITVDKIKALKPCENRFSNFVSNYPGFEGSLTDFLKLDNITYDDKVWVSVRLLTKNQLVKWSIMCAESVKDKFESKYPENKSLSNLLAYLNDIPDFENITKVQRSRIWDLRREVRTAAYTAAYAAADAAYTAAYAAYTAAYAAYTAADAAYTAAADAAYTAAYAAYTAAAYTAAYTAAAREEQRNLNLLYLASLDQD